MMKPSKYITLYEKYGYCVVPRGSLVFHKGKIHKNADSVFFGLCPITAHVNPGQNKKIQIWRFKKSAKLLFMIISVAHYSWTKSSIVEIYRNYFPHAKPCNDIEIKYLNKSRRRKLISRIKEEKIIGWFSSYDDRYELEICIFKDENFNNLIEPVQEVEMSNVYRVGFENPLKKIRLIPNSRFFEISKSELKNFAYKKYCKHVHDCIEEDLKSGHSKIYAQNANYTLRMKLKI